MIKFTRKHRQMKSSIINDTSNKAPIFPLTKYYEITKRHNRKVLHIFVQGFVSNIWVSHWGVDIPSFKDLIFPQTIIFYCIIILYFHMYFILLFNRMPEY